MTRREYPLRITCTQGGCGETITYRYETRRDYDNGARDNRERPWKCDKHRNPDAYLKPGNESTQCVLTAVRVPHRYRGEIAPGEFLPGLYWHEEGKTTGSGHRSGPGFVADADEFPEGTRLVVTTQILPPEEAECCDLHGRNCEPPSELCCENCTEERHAGWTDERGVQRFGHPAGETCSSPVPSLPTAQKEPQFPTVQELGGERFADWPSQP